MKRYILIGVLVFSILMATGLVVYVNFNYQKQLEAQNQVELQNKEPVYEYDLEELKKEILALSNWENITEDDKITFAFGSQPEIIKRVTESLKDNRYVICYSIGGRLDTENKGSYFIMTGFDNLGKVKILSPQNDYKEKSYIYERVFENVEKILFFDAEDTENER